MGNTGLVRSLGEKDSQDGDEENQDADHQRPHPGLAERLVFLEEDFVGLCGHGLFLFFAGGAILQKVIRQRPGNLADGPHMPVAMVQLGCQRGVRR